MGFGLCIMRQLHEAICAHLHLLAHIARLQLCVSAYPRSLASPNARFAMCLRVKIIDGHRLNQPGIIEAETVPERD